MSRNAQAKAREAVVRHLRSHADHQRYLAARHEGCPDAGCPAIYVNAAELLRQLADAVEGGLLAQPGDEDFPGASGSLWRDTDGDLWVHCADRQMRLITETEEPDSPAGLECHAGPMTREEKS